MTREEKAQAIENLTAQLGDSTNIYLTDVSGLDAAKTSNLQRGLLNNQNTQNLALVDNRDTQKRLKNFFARFL